MSVKKFGTKNYVLGLERITLYIGLLKIVVGNFKTERLTKKSYF